MKVAVEGCLHGELDQVYAHIARVQEKIQEKMDLLIICGDFQSIRHQPDLDDMHCPEKYKEMGTFRDYFEGKKKAGVLTVLIGGNHEAVNSLRESHFGGWLAPKIYFLGQAGSIFVRKGSKKLRITGCSGIYNHTDFKYCTKVETYPLRGKERITAYHTKQIDIFRMQLLSRINIMKKDKPEEYGQGYTNFDIMLSHDWPKDIALFGNTEQLFKIKPYFQKEVQAGTLGSQAMHRIMLTAQPNYWFSAHMHVKYPAIYPHKNNLFTHFLSLDKCLSQRSCIQLLQFDMPETQKEVEDKQVKIEIDSTWIAVLLLTHKMMKGGQNLYYFDKQNLKLTDAPKMNQMIKSYPSLRKRIDEIGTYSFPEDVDQMKQTEHFLKTIGISLEEVEGICFEKGIFLQEPEDQIELDL